MINAFDQIYKNKIWECNGVLSGAGSHPDSADDYINYLRQFKERKVLDLGCGDLSIYGGGIFFKKYIGVDVVDISKYKILPTNIIVSSIESFRYDLYDFDLILIKDVFQHLSNNHVLRLLNILLKLNVDMLITNDFNGEPFNSDCGDGDYRSLNMIIDPFNLKPKLKFDWLSKFDGRHKQSLIV